MSGQHSGAFCVVFRVLGDSCFELSSSSRYLASKTALLLKQAARSGRFVNRPYTINSALPWRQLTRSGTACCDAGAGEVFAVAKVKLLVWLAVKFGLSAQVKLKMPALRTAKRAFLVGYYSRSFTRDRAASSATRMKSGCSCRMEPGAWGQMGPKKQSFTA